MTTTIPEVRNHYPVLLSELISIINPQYGGTFIDCTFGQGGYTKKGLSFDTIGELNMKMGINDFSAKEAINQLDEKELTKIFKYFGDRKSVV